MGINILKVSFWEVYHGIYVTIGNHVLWLSCNIAVKQISDSISDDISPQMKILNMVIPILMYFQTLIQ